MRYIRLLLEYDGTDYHGWQSQTAGATLQDTIVERIFSITGERVRLTGASRTDAGVHALGQVAVFGTNSSLDTAVIMRALNAKLPSDIRVLDAAETGGGFHPRFGAKRKSYYYVLSTARKQSVFLHRYVWDLKAPLAVGAMLEASGLIAGEHDFSSFRASGCGAKNPVRTVYAVDVTPMEEMRFMTAAISGEFVRIGIEANAFLRHMVRNIVGTLVDVGTGRLSVQDFKRIFSACDRKEAGPTAPARGLFLERITY